MTWIAFDTQTRNAVGETLGEPVKLAPASTDPLDYALASRSTNVFLAPGKTEGEVVLLTVKRNVRTVPAALPKQEVTRTSHYVTSGFLGLNDEVEVEEEPEQRKSWWKRLFD
jgi:hypothetical protein